MWTVVARRVKESFTRVLAATVAATLAFAVARLLLGQPNPVFAAITALSCVAPGIPSHFKSSVQSVIGVLIGIVVGELIFLIPEHMEELRTAAAVLLAMLIACVLGLPAITNVQAGSSALLVIVMGPHYAGLSRFLDVSVGFVVGMAFAVIFFRDRLNFRE
jgi:uncharacterized membrane protein YgaE (UPF0421/DUF939 family)